MTELTGAYVMNKYFLNLRFLNVVIPWIAAFIILMVAPLIFNSGSAISVLAQMGTMVIFALSYNMLLGQGGMLSFGHAVYSGLGAYFAVHAMNMASEGDIWMPVWLVPLVGGFAGMLIGVILGYVSTKKAGLPFAMITLGVAELVYAASYMFPDFFGGEGGLWTNRVYGESTFGVDFGSQRQVYYLISIWLFISAIAMFAYSRTPLGRISNAVRDNPERVEFIGYNTRLVRYITLIFSGFFAGISGALIAINYEIVTVEFLSIETSGYVLLFTFIGGAAFFLGPVIGSIVGIIFTSVLSSYTAAWHLYLGILFVLVVMYLPGGMMSLIDSHIAIFKGGLYRKIAMPMLRICLSGALALFGLVLIIELFYVIFPSGKEGALLPGLGINYHESPVSSWMIALVCASSGLLASHLSKKSFLPAWEDAQKNMVSSGNGEGEQ